MKRVLLWNMPDSIVLIVEHASGVVYQNQVGGDASWQIELQGVLVPLELDPEAARNIEQAPYTSSREGLSQEGADQIDAALAAGPYTRTIKVDRARLGDCWEAWVYVTIDAPASDQVEVQGNDYFGPLYGFGAAKGVLTWPA